MIIRKLTLLCAIFLLALSGCIFSPKKKDGPPPPPDKTYPVPSQPTIALANYVKAYMIRDSVEVDSIFAPAYVGTSKDNSATGGPTTTTFTKADEVAHVGALYRRTSITGVTLDFGPSLVRSTSLGDPAGWATIQITYVNLQIDDVPTSYSVSSAGEEIDFKFVPTLVPPGVSPTDTTWKIIQWNEVHN